jgi:hypothetical protein
MAAQGRRQVTRAKATGVGDGEDGGGDEVRRDGGRRG